MFSLLFPDNDHLLESYTLPSLSAPQQPAEATSTQHHRSHTTVSTSGLCHTVTCSITLSPKEEEATQPISLITVLVVLSHPPHKQSTPLPSTQSASPREEAKSEVQSEVQSEVKESEEKEEAELVLDSSSSDDEAEAAFINAVSLQSVRQRAQASPILISGHTPSLSDTSLPTGQSTTQSSTLFTLLDCPDDVQRLQVLLALMSAYHQSVYNGLTLTAQQAAFATPPPDLQGYFLCNDAYGAVATHALCSVLKATTLRPVTAQCTVYVMKYLLANHVYGDVFPAQVLEDLADT